MTGRCPGMTVEMREGHEGTGPGAITPDGRAVELYDRLPVGDEPDIITAAVPAGAHILELGSGVGRMTHALLERGFTVTAVDESADMSPSETGSTRSGPSTCSRTRSGPRRSCPGL
ncbi:hypothetical protein GCM10010503_51970 [Streptomyces lucensis JCM 4490]|uniref:Methyltransferase n=1 Tax=Streptomyces lucensis JCM 4490 TaxID=1306176 RepID=A0A918MSS6_9ACTN|nr:hypothetical protein GCM10010503_51970 [Streptomyces lucensis JCM 4490]